MNGFRVIKMSHGPGRHKVFMENYVEISRPEKIWQSCKKLFSLVKKLIIR